MNKARKGPAFLVIFLMLLLIAAYIYAAYQTVKPARGLICNGVCYFKTFFKKIVMIIL